MILLCGLALTRPAHSQQADSAKTHISGIRDSTHQAIFSVTNTSLFQPPHRRSIDVAITGGAGYYRQGAISPFQPTANADFYAQTTDLDLTAGFHFGFSDPYTAGLSFGLRFPIAESEDGASGFFADGALLITDNGVDTVAFSTGLRAALAERTGPLEIRLAGEVRRFPFDGPFLGWAGLELGFVINLEREEVSAPTPKDSLRAALRYIATSAELDELDKASATDEINTWLDRFWQARNVTGSPHNDARIEYMNRVQYVNQHYGTLRTMGTNTDQGRVYLLYGKPDRIEVENSVSGADKKYALWIDEDRIKGYHTALFLFVSSNFSNARGTYEGHGEFREIYSNVNGEPSEGIPYDLPPAMQNYIEGFR
jgi:GWxTD domain-containing protein